MLNQLRFNGLLGLAFFHELDLDLGLTFLFLIEFVKPLSMDKGKFDYKTRNDFYQLALTEIILCGRPSKASRSKINLPS